MVLFQETKCTVLVCDGVCMYTVHAHMTALVFFCICAFIFRIGSGYARVDAIRIGVLCGSMLVVYVR